MNVCRIKWTTVLCCLLTTVFAGMATAQTPPGQVTPAGGRCTIQLTFNGCQMCCDLERRINGPLNSICQAGALGIGGYAGGPIGAGIGRLAGGFACRVMTHEGNCNDRCTGKDGDPSPIRCSSPFDPSETGVCRQVCEQGQHDMGPGTCPANFSLDLRCCNNEYNPPDDDPCSEDVCPGFQCPPWCPQF